MSPPLASLVVPRFPSTRYQGSKRRLADRIVEQAQGLSVHSVLDVFGGTGAVAYAFKRAGKAVVYNDVLAFNHQIGLALIANDDRRLSPDEVEWLFGRHAGVDYGDVIERHFEDIYFTREENQWLDRVVCNIRSWKDEFARALAWYALFQSAMAKRPYNLFHRRNLYMREAAVRRTFGNKTSWDRPFAEHFRQFAQEANRAVLCGQRPCRAMCGDALHAPRGADLVYMDPPYMNARGQSVDYQHFYHFLEGMVSYVTWADRIDFSSRHRRLRAEPNPWLYRDSMLGAFEELLNRFEQAVWLISYRGDGWPSPAQLEEILKGHGKSVQRILLSEGPYVLSKRKGTGEILYVCQ